MKEVIKNGSVVDFDKSQVIRAITMKAFKQSSEPMNKELAEKNSISK